MVCVAKQLRRKLQRVMTRTEPVSDHFKVGRTVFDPLLLLLKVHMRYYGVRNIVFYRYHSRLKYFLHSTKDILNPKLRSDF